MNFCSQILTHLWIQEDDQYCNVNQFCLHCCQSFYDSPSVEIFDCFKLSIIPNNLDTDIGFLVPFCMQATNMYISFKMLIVWIHVLRFVYDLLNTDVTTSVNFCNYIYDYIVEHPLNLDIPLNLFRTLHFTVILPN